MACFERSQLGDSYLVSVLGMLLYSGFVPVADGNLAASIQLVVWLAQKALES